VAGRCGSTGAPTSAARVPNRMAEIGMPRARRVA
jgi:hypothetical protein